MGRSYHFECSKCGYRAKVSGRGDRGVSLFVQTIACRDCRELYDAVTRLKLPVWPAAVSTRPSFDLPNPGFTAKNPPSFQAALNRLTITGAPQYEWVRFTLQCPVFSFHKVQPWNDPDKCPRCGVFLERAALPYRMWD